MQVQGRNTHAGLETALHTITFMERSALKCIFSSLPAARLDVPPQQLNVVCANDDMLPASAWLEYPFRISHLIISWLPSYLAACFSENHGHELGIPPMSCLDWTAGELNAILENRDNLYPSHCCKGQLWTFCFILWECELYNGRPKARCYPFNLSGHLFRGKNRQVHVVHVICYHT